MRTDAGNRLTLREAFAIVYGRDPSSEEMGRLRHFGLEESSGPALSQMRAVGSAFERYTHPTALSVRFAPDDLVTIELENFRFIADRRDFAIGHLVIASGGFENHVTKAIRQFLRPGMTAVDIGANVGFQTMHMASVVGAAGKVFAIEPSSENCRLIILNAAANDFKQIEVHPVALSDSAGFALLTTAIGSNGLLFPSDAGNPSCVVVPRATLDDLVRDRHIDFIKIDVEGSEYRAMSGARATLERCRPVIVSEFSPVMIEGISGIAPAEYLSMMTALGYTVHLINKEHGVQAAVSPDMLLAEWGSAGRIEDLVFIPCH